MVVSYLKFSEKKYNTYSDFPEYVFYANEKDVAPFNEDYKKLNLYYDQLHKYYPIDKMPMFRKDLPNGVKKNIFVKLQDSRDYSFIKGITYKCVYTINVDGFNNKNDSVIFKIDFIHSI